ncbi:glycosyltransferase [Microgenomates group bacterium]|nr:glycosyltransferase [Microgenomates group bacterium]
MITFSSSPYHRRPQYRLQTRLHDQKRIEKVALSPQALPHLKTIAHNHQLLRRAAPSLRPISYRLAASSLTTPFLPFPSLAKLIETALLKKNFATAHQHFLFYLSLIYSLPVKKTFPLKNPAFVKLFSSTSPSPDLSFSCLQTSSLDLNLSNLLISSDNKPHLIDQEWLLPDYTLPRSFLLFLSVLDLSFRLQDAIRNHRSSAFICYQFSPQLFIPQVWLDSLLLEPHLIPLFISWYNHFQSLISLSPSPLPSPQLPLKLDFPSSLPASSSRLKDLKRRLFLALPTRLQNEYVFFKENGPLAELSRPYRKFARHFFTRALALTPPPSSPDHVLVISGSQKTVSHRHRVLHFCDKLDLLSIPHHSLTTDNFVPQLPRLPLENFRLLFIHRATSSLQLLELIHFFRSRDLPVVFDIDDLVFDPQHLALLASSKTFSPLSLQIEHQHLLGFLSLIKHCTHATVPTLPLQHSLQQLFPHLSISLLPNHLDQTSLNQAFILAQAHLAHSSSPRRPFTLGYFPGTATHDRDFLVLVPALQKVLASHPSIHLKIVGFLSLPPELDHFVQKGQITHSSAVPYDQLISQYQNVHLNLCPLEQTSFNAAKSDLKYFFAGACAIPTLASPSPVLEEIAARGGGLITCPSSPDWQNNILNLFHNPSKLKSLAKKAYQDCRERYSPEYHSQKLGELLNNLNFPIAGGVY